MGNKIPFNDFTADPFLLRKEIQDAMQRVLDSGWYILGKELELFEKNFAAYTGTRFCAGVASGTEAIALSLMALDIGPGDEVITTNLTAFPTITGIMQSGAKPVVVDIFSDTGLIDYRKVEAEISGRTKAVVPVHLYGQSCDMTAIMHIATKYGLHVVEDCAQAAGATFREQKCGSVGVCGAFSFYPTKNLGAYGDAGAVTTSNEEIYFRINALRNYGQTKKYCHDLPGINSRLDELQAAILNVKLKYLDRGNQERRRLASLYRDRLKTVECLKEEPYGKSSYHLFVIKTPFRDALALNLQEKGIQTLIHYPLPVSQQKAFLWQNDRVFPESSGFAGKILSLPLYPGLSDQRVDYIIKSINEFQQ